MPSCPACIALLCDGLLSACPDGSVAFQKAFHFTHGLHSFDWHMLCSVLLLQTVRCMLGTATSGLSDYCALLLLTVLGWYCSVIWGMCFGSESVSRLVTPQKLFAFWQQASASCYKVYGWPINKLPMQLFRYKSGPLTACSQLN